MYRVMLVEDEKIIREGLKISLDWEQFELSVVAEARDGIEGLAIAREVRPHLIFSDIRMPGMDGLEFAQNVLQVLPDVKIIIISGYKDYDYIRQSLQLGLFDYLLKPIDQEELERVVQKAVQQIHKDESSKQMNIETNSLIRQSRNVLHSAMLNRLTLGDLDPLQLPKTDPFLQGLTMESYMCAVLRIENLQEAVRGRFEGDEAALLFSLLNICEESASKDTFVFQQYGLNKQITLLKGMKSSSEAKEAEHFLQSCRRLLANIKQFGKIEANIGIGQAHSGWKRIHSSYVEACVAVEQTTFAEHGQLKLAETKSVHKSTVLTTPEFESLLQDAIKQRDEEKIRGFITALFHSTEARNATRKEVFDTMGRMVAFVNQIHPHDEDLNRGKDYLMNLEFNLFRSFDSIEEIIGWMYEYVAVRLSGGNPVYPNSHVLIQRLKDYVTDNFSSDQVSLSFLSVKFGMSIYQICRLFKREFGVNFHVYLTELKMQRAKEYLRGTSMSVQDIAYLVGYKELKYFFKVFKKQSGLTPSEYRNHRS
ncbi:response regulator [Paenibacillus sp. GCM10027628]|uniref:response regulator n=1 Tax=Paenibacillus sp. GCM10027628 TaxID=3273413 RepID=UPI003645B442